MGLESKLQIPEDRTTTELKPLYVFVQETIFIIVTYVVWKCYDSLHGLFVL
jgi:hypothetical protein